MPKYISLISRTDKGATTIGDAIERLAASREYAKKLGASFDIYMTNGAYDMVVITDAPNDEASMKMKLATESRGFLRMTSMRAFTETEFAGLVSSL